VSSQRRKNDGYAILSYYVSILGPPPLPVQAIAARVHLETSKGANANLHKYMSGQPGPEAGSSQRAKKGKNEIFYQ